MLIRCFVGTLNFIKSKQVSITEHVECPAILDTDTGHLHLEAKPRHYNVPKYHSASTVDITIGTRMYALDFDIERSLVLEGELAEHHEEFVALYLAQQTLGISGNLIYH